MAESGGCCFHRTNAYALTHSIPSEKYADVKEFFATYVTDKDVRRAIEDRKFQLLGTDISTYTIILMLYVLINYFSLKPAVMMIRLTPFYILMWRRSVKNLIATIAPLRH